MSTGCCSRSTRGLPFRSRSLLEGCRVWACHRCGRRIPLSGSVLKAMGPTRPETGLLPQKGQAVGKSGSHRNRSLGCLSVEVSAVVSEAYPGLQGSEGPVGTFAPGRVPAPCPQGLGCGSEAYDFIGGNEERTEAGQARPRHCACPGACPHGPFERAAGRREGTHHPMP